MDKHEFTKFVLLMVALIVVIFTPLCVGVGMHLIEMGLVVGLLLIGMLVVSVLQLRERFREERAEVQEEEWKALLRRRNFLRSQERLARGNINHLRELDQRREYIREARWEALYQHILHAVPCDEPTACDWADEVRDECFKY